ncbi:MAG TPA: hypothetical protein PKD84_12935 [Propionicimonas sp.]|jgi:2-keto-3-deoxy-galactonokinase|nr:hypothetical protein [Propionicimonas sp.]
MGTASTRATTTDGKGSCRGSNNFSQRGVTTTIYRDLRTVLDIRR